MTPIAIATRTRATVRTGFELSIERYPATTDGVLTTVDAAWPARVRHIARATLSYWSQPDLIDSAELLLTELLTNAFQHGHGDDVGVRLYCRGPRMVIEVRDGSPDRPVMRRASPDDEDGRGLALISAMADEWGTSPDGTTTWCTLPLCKGPDDPMQRPAASVPVLRDYPAIQLPGNPSAVTRARTIARSGITVLGWQGDVHAATEVVARLVGNGVAHGVVPHFPGKGVTIQLRINETRQLVIDVSDPNPKFPDFEAALQGEQGQGLWEVQRRHAEITWFIPPNGTGKTVRATMTPGPVDL
ncbi:ATP-binding protein [Streptomyces avermitilis]|uniref:ATP-binding protein n=1 Tax=Streptomyces avermitilis TaxID=33903 RepID=UPI0033A8063B